MFSSSILQLLFSLLGMAFLVRAWLYAIRLHPFNPFSQTIFKATDWAVLSLRKLVPNRQYLDWPSLLGAYLTALIFFCVQLLAIEGLSPSTLILPILLMALLEMVRWAMSMIFWLTIAQAILSWVNPQAPIMPILRTLTDPLLQPIRRIMPNLGALDLSPIVLILGSQLLSHLVLRAQFAVLMPTVAPL